MSTDGSDSSLYSQTMNSWFELSKSDYAKVIFCDLYQHPDSVGCRFQITDNVHEDPNDYIGLFRVGYENLSQCLVSKFLSETECEENGKILRCMFKKEEIPEIDGFFQFLYVTRDNEVCGASMPFVLKDIQAKEESSDEDIVADGIEDDFLVVRSNLIEKNRALQVLVETYREKNQALSKKLVDLNEEKMKVLAKNEKVISGLQEELLNMKRNSVIEETRINRLSDNLNQVTQKLQQEVLSKSELISAKKRLVEEKQNLLKFLSDKDDMLAMQKNMMAEDKSMLLEQLEDGKMMIKALEDSKVLALKEVNELSELLSKQKKTLSDVQEKNRDLELKVKKGQDEIQKLEKCVQELKLMNDSLTQQVKDYQLEIQKQNKEISELRNGQKELENTESNVESVKMLKESLHDSKCKSYALELDLEDKEKEIEKYKETINDWKCSNFSLNCKLEDKQAEILKLEKTLEDMKSSVNASFEHQLERLKLTVKEQCEEILKLREENEMLNIGLKVEVPVEEEKLELQVTEPRSCQANALSEIEILQRMNAELKIKVAELLNKLGEADHSKCEQEVSGLKTALNEKTQALEKVTSQLNNFQSLCFQWEDQISDLKSLCAELHGNIAKKDAAIEKLKEDVLKKDAVIEFLNKEKNECLKSEATLRDAFGDAASRLKDAADIYKKQFIEIEKLNKKIRKLQTSRSKVRKSIKCLNSENFDVDGSLSKRMNEKDCHSIETTSVEHNTSDSDTGEHVSQWRKPPQCESVFVLEKPCIKTVTETYLQSSLKEEDEEQAIMQAGSKTFLENKVDNISPCADSDSSNEKQNKESPSLSTMIEQNLASLSASGSKSESEKSPDEDTISIPCGICEKVIVSHDTNAIMHHLELEHKQEMCPICGKLFDMTLPKNYLVFHVEDHFQN